MAKPSPCQPDEAEPAVIARIGTDGTVVLADGRELLVASLLRPDGKTGGAEWPALLPDWLRHQHVSWKATGEEDRWGRIPAQLFVQEPSRHKPPFWLQAGLVQHGRAAIWSGKLPAVCQAILVSGEREALMARRGIWSPGQQEAWQASLQAEAERHVGTRAALVMRVHSVRPWNQGAFVNFVPSFRDGFALYLTTRQMEALRNAQRDPFSWQGKRLLVRLVINDPSLRRLRIESIDQIVPID